MESVLKPIACDGKSGVHLGVRLRVAREQDLESVLSMYFYHPTSSDLDLRSLTSEPKHTAAIRTCNNLDPNLKT